jgi:hypothetical protein
MSFAPLKMAARAENWMRKKERKKAPFLKMLPKRPGVIHSAQQKIVAKRCLRYFFVEFFLSHWTNPKQCMPKNTQHV